MITNEQKEARRHSIGGSDMPIIMGLSNYKTPYQLYLEKLGLLEDTQEESQFAYWGNKLEPVIRDEFADRHDVIVSLPDTIYHPLFPHLHANVDGFVDSENLVLEVKCANSFMAKEWGEPGSDVIPLQYLVQVAHYCACANASGAYIAVLIGGYDYREYYYQRDLELESQVIDAANEFWNCVQTQKEPPATAMIDLKLKYPMHIQSTEVIAGEAEFKALGELLEVKKKAKELKQIEEAAKFKIAAYMKDAEFLTDISGKPMATYKANKKGSRSLLLKAKEV